MTNDDMPKFMGSFKTDEDAPDLTSEQQRLIRQQVQARTHGPPDMESVHAITSVVNEMSMYAVLRTLALILEAMDHSSTTSTYDDKGRKLSEEQGKVRKAQTSTAISLINGAAHLVKDHLILCIPND